MPRGQAIEPPHQPALIFSPEGNVTYSTISVGIDLGTTNSSVAVNNNGTIEIVKKPGGLEYTPSVFGFDKAKNKVVGQRAYESLYSDKSETGVKNFRPEVKRIMGTPEKFYFERTGVEMSAEEISSEILKSLVQDILRKYQKFDTTAAVITIPAAFSILQCEATKRAGNLAGFKHVVLLQGNCSRSRHAASVKGFPARVRRMASRAPMARRRAVSITERMSA